jgi:hypothetical protein
LLPFGSSTGSHNHITKFANIKSGVENDNG